MLHFVQKTAIVHLLALFNRLTKANHHYKAYKIKVFMNNNGFVKHFKITLINGQVNANRWTET